jgi:Ti-type conjugative transfer relaxase TraA
LEDKRLALVERHREAREKLETKQEARRIEEIKARLEKLPTGLKAAWFKLSGRYETLCVTLEADALRCKTHDRAEYQALIKQQLSARRRIQTELEQLQSEFDIVSKLLKSDPAQNLVIPPDPEASTIKAKVRRDPAHILKVITDKNETFTRSDIVRGLAEHFTDPLSLGSAVKKAMQSNALIEVQPKPNQRYSTLETINLKFALSDCVDQLAQSDSIVVASRHVDAAIAKQDKTLDASVGASLSGEQKTAIQHCVSPVQISCVVGLAGSGKSTMLSAVRDAYERQGLNIRGATLSGKAADELENSSGIRSRTLASLERSWKKGFEELTPKDVLVIDEAGMIGTRQLYRFIEQVQKSGAKIILVGDPEQLQPINAGTPFKDFTEQVGAISLREIHRQKKDWQKQASLDLAERRIDKALDAYEAHGNVKQTRDTSEAISHLVSDYMFDRSANTDGTKQLALAYRRKDVFAINQQIRSEWQSVGELSNEVLLQTKHGKRAFAVNDRILLTENDHTLGVKNGMLGTVESVTQDKLVISLDADKGKSRRSVTINPNLYYSYDHGYATTIHKSQGATVDKTYVLGSVLMDRHLTYVAMTRHKQNTTFYGDFYSIQKMCRSGVDRTEKRQQIRSKYRRRGPTMH